MHSPGICLRSLFLGVVGLAAACSGYQSPAAPRPQAARASAAAPTRTIVFNNNCSQTLWIASTGNAIPGCASNADCPGKSTCVNNQCQCSSDADCGSGLSCNGWASPATCYYAPAAGGGFQLTAGQQGYSVTIPLVSWTGGPPTSWPGRFWPRTGCSFMQATCSKSSDCKGSACSGSSCACVGGSCLPTCTTNAGCTSVSANAQCPLTPEGKVCLPHPACETGDCNGLLNCESGLSGQPPVALAELNLFLPPTSDFYDVSNVNGYAIVGGENIGVSITPQAGTFPAPVEAPPPGAKSCSSDSDCTWFSQCDPSTNLCVNAHQCGAAGCISSTACAVPCTGCGTILQASSWNLDSSCGGYAELAVVSPVICSTTQDCPGNATCSGGFCSCTKNTDCGTAGSVCGVTEFAGGVVGQACGTFIGCASADQACSFGGSAPPSALNCSTNINLYGCSDYNANLTNNSQSCYTSGTNGNCCGCPSWTPTSINPSASNGKLCQADNSSWENQQPENYALAFHSAAPTAYSFSYDDTINTMTCTGVSATNNVVYTVTFCPQESLSN